MIYVEEIHKPVVSPKIELHIDNLDKPLQFTIKAPAATAMMVPTSSAVTSGWSAKGKTTINATDSFEFSVVEGAVTLLPYKVTLVGKEQIEIRPLTDLDLEYARGQFAMNENFQNLEIVYPEPME